MESNKINHFVFATLFYCSALAQNSVSVSSSLLKDAKGADSNYIQTYTLPNDVRLIAGGQGTGIGFQSLRDEGFNMDLKTYTNVSDLIGFGMTYKFIDFDLLVSLNSAIILPDGRQNLTQIKLSTSYTARKNSFRVYYSESKGMISTDPAIDYESSSDIHLRKIGGQITRLFNSKHYSYRAANFQSELQKKTSGSFLVRMEPFYRELGMRSASISSLNRNVKQVFGDLAGLYYMSSFGMVLMPGYGVNLIFKQNRFYTCPMLLIGPGISYNKYNGVSEDYTSYSFEMNGALMLNSGYNGNRIYINLRASADLCYSYFDPSVFNTTEIKIYLTFGFRFRNLENKIPSSFL